MPTLPMPDSFGVRISKAEHVFSAAHFITFDGTCERLHGHNYRVAAEFRGPLNESHLLIDFVLVRAKLREIVGRPDGNKKKGKVRFSCFSSNSAVWIALKEWRSALSPTPRAASSGVSGAGGVGFL